MFDLSKYYIELGGSNGTFFKRKEYVQLCDVAYNKKVTNFFNRYDKDNYYGVYAYEDIKDIEHCRLYGDLYFDLDGNIHTEKGFNTLRMDAIKLIIFFKSIGLTENEIDVYFSGAKGFHVLIPATALGIAPSSDLNKIYKAWALYLFDVFQIKSLDTAIYDRKRLFRIPGSINSKTGLKKEKIKIALLYSCKNYNDFSKNIELYKDDSIKERRKLNKKAAYFFYTKSHNFYRKHTDKPVKAVIIPEKKEELLPCVKKALETGAISGNRNNTLVMISSSVMQSGYRLEETLDMMHNQWNENNEEPLAFNEIELTVRSAYSMLLSGKKYGCNALKEAGFCIGNKCRIQQQRKE